MNEVNSSRQIQKNITETLIKTYKNKRKVIKTGYIQGMRLMRLHLGFSGVGTFHHGAFGNTGFVFNTPILLQ